MPYANIHWIKLKLELLNDKRFIFDCNNNQKWLFVGLLLLAGSTKNNVADDENYLKNRLNLPESSQEIRENLEHLFKTFPKLISKNGIIKFKNFNDLHHKLGNYFGTPLDDQSDTKGNKEKISKIREEYIKIKGWDIKNFTSDDYARTGKAIKTILIKAKSDEEALAALKWASQQKWCDWTLETIIKQWQNFLKSKEKPKEIIPECLTWKKEAV